MLYHRVSFVMISLTLLQTVLSYYQENSLDGEADDIGDETNDASAGISWKSNDDDAYQENFKDIVLMKENPQLYFVTSVDRNRDNMARLTASKRTMSTMNNGGGGKDATKVPGKSSLSIISPLEALQRKVAVVYNIRQKERNRGLLNDYGKRSIPISSAYEVFEPEQNDAVLQSEIKQLKQVPHIQRRKFYGFYKVP